MKKLLPFFISIYILSSCGTNVQETAQNNISSAVETVTPYSLNFEINEKLAPLEPDSGIVYGFNTDFDTLKEFEDYNNINANHYVYEYVLGTEFSDLYMLNTLASGKTAYIKVIPSKYNKYNLMEIYYLCNKIRPYNIPCYIELFPEPSEADYSAEKYKKYFEQASNLIRREVSNTSIIFTPNSDELFASEKFYPNADNYDFVGFNYIGYVVDDGVNIFNDFYCKFNYVYNANYEEKPIFITNFALSNFSNTHNTYYISENIKYTNDIFNDLSNNYYKVKGINFYNNVAYFTNEKYNNDNYIIVDNNKIKDNLQKQLSQGNFVNKYEFTRDYHYEKNVYDAILANNTYYVSEKINQNKHVKKMNYEDNVNSYIFNENRYLNLDEFLKSNNNLNISIDDASKTINIKS